MKRKFLYYLKLRDGMLVYAEGHDPEEAFAAAGVTAAQVKRHMPVKALLTEEELEKARKRFDQLRARAAAEKLEREQRHKEEVIDEGD